MDAPRGAQFIESRNGWPELGAHTLVGIRQKSQGSAAWKVHVHPASPLIMMHASAATASLLSSWLVHILLYAAAAAAAAAAITFRSLHWRSEFSTTATAPRRAPPPPPPTNLLCIHFIQLWTDEVTKLDGFWEISRFALETQRQMWPYGENEGKKFMAMISGHDKNGNPLLHFRKEAPCTTNSSRLGCPAMSVCLVGLP